MGGRLRPRLAGWRSGWVHGHPFHKSTHTFSFPVGLSICLGCSFLLNMTKELRPFRPPIIHKCFDILLQTIDRILHLAVPLLGAVKARFKIKVFLVYPLILGSYGRALSRHTFVFTLLRSNSSVL